MTLIDSKPAKIQEPSVWPKDVGNQRTFQRGCSNGDNGDLCCLKVSKSRGFGHKLLSVTGAIGNIDEPDKFKGIKTQHKADKQTKWKHQNILGLNIGFSQLSWQADVGKPLAGLLVPKFKAIPKPLVLCRVHFCHVSLYLYASGIESLLRCSDCRCIDCRGPLWIETLCQSASIRVFLNVTLAGDPATLCVAHLWEHATERVAQARPACLAVSLFCFALNVIGVSRCRLPDKSFSWRVSISSA